MARTPFKMKSGNAPLRKESRDWTGSNQGDTRSAKRAKLTSDINSFFSGLGKSVKDVANKLGVKKKTLQERNAWKKDANAGESRYQYNVRKRREGAKTVTSKAKTPPTNEEKGRAKGMDRKGYIVPKTSTIKPPAPTTTKDYNSMSVNDLVKLRKKGNKDVQKVINAKLKANPNKWD